MQHAVSEPAGEGRWRALAIPADAARSNALARDPVNLVDGTKNRTCVAIRNAAGHQGKSPISSNNYRAALERLFPDTAPENIVDLPREQLLDLITAGRSQYAQQQQESPAVANSVQTQNPALSTGQSVLECLHSMPEDQLDEGQCAGRSESLEHVSDDVNALSLTSQQSASYLGISSTQAAVKVIACLHPQLKSYSFRTLRKRKIDGRVIGPQTSAPATEMEMLDAYFSEFQPLAPLLDEKSFRVTHLVAERKDSRWLALLNIVLALGSIVASGPDDNSHRIYFERSMNLLDLTTLGTPTLESVQTLGLIGGWYCHYASQPNLGYSLMGASLRMAVTLGLQREPYNGHSVLDPARASNRELRRRVWWSLCCLETWGHETLGRPRMDLFAPSITVSKPCVLTEIGNGPQEKYLQVLPVIENMDFVKIASKIQESLASVPTLTYAETLDMDSQLLQWWNNLPPVLRDYEPCPGSLYTTRTVMRWRYNNQRMLLYRPQLLSYAIRRVPFMAVREDERDAILKCREIAEVTIRDVSKTAKLNRMLGWNGVWFLFQATMVPLIYLSTRPTNDDCPTVLEACKIQIETAMLTLDRMKRYAHTAQRTLEVISGILEVCMQGTQGLSPDATAEGFGSQNFPYLTDSGCDTSATRDRLSDWTAASFESLPPQTLWEYLSWGVRDTWSDLPDIRFEDEEMSFLQPTGEGV